MRPRAFYGFNTIVFLAFLRTYSQQGDRLLRIAGVLFSLSILIQVASISVGSRPLVRDIGFFNNPNQLGYYALLAASIITVTQLRFRLSVVWAGSCLLGALWLAAISLSKAALGGVVGLILLLTGARPRIILLMIVLALGLSRMIDLTPLGQNIQARVEHLGWDDSLEGRGYDRIWKYPEYLVFGAGEGADDRFGWTAEIHSTFAMVLFCYGIPGSFLFLAFFYELFCLAGWQYFKFLLPALLYGLTHQGLRFTEFWILMAVVTCVGMESSPARSRKIARRVLGPGHRRIRLVRASA